jgi:hypothetical protein
LILLGRILAPLLIFNDPANGLHAIELGRQTAEIQRRQLGASDPRTGGAIAAASPTAAVAHAAADHPVADRID